MWSHQMQTAAKEHFVAIQWIFIKIGLGLRLGSDQSSPQETTHLYACAGSTQRLHIFVLSEDKLQKNRLLSIIVLFGKRSRNFYEWPSNKTGCWFYTSDLSVPNGSSHVQKFTKTTKALLKQFALWMGIQSLWICRCQRQLPLQVYPTEYFNNSPDMTARGPISLWDHHWGKLHLT